MHPELSIEQLLRFLGMMLQPDEGGNNEGTRAGAACAIQ